MSVDPGAPGRLPGAPVAIVDIGSNSVRLVAYEALSRAPTPIFNEKVLCGLGRGVATTGLLADDAMDKALAALRCFRTMCRTMAITDVHVIATAATRDARNGAAFLERAEQAIGVPIDLINGLREAELSAKGVIAGVYHADGLVGDLGGGSLELVDVAGATIGPGLSLPLGGLALSDLSKNSPRRAVKIVRDALADAAPLAALRGRTFYAVGGTWRALAKLHMEQRRYPIHVMQGYSIPADDPDLFAMLIERSDTDAPLPLASVSSARRPLLAFGAVVLEEIIRAARPKTIMISALGVREGMLFEKLTAAAQAADPLLVAASDFNRLRARDPAHAEDLCAWTDLFIGSLDAEENPEQRRLRHAACLVSDVAWRSHPDYRGSAALTTVANAAFTGLDHVDRCFLGAVMNHRHEGMDSALSSEWRNLMPPAVQDRARLIGGAMRVAFQLSTAMGGMLPRTPLEVTRDRLTLTLPPDATDLASMRLQNRLKQLGKFIGREAEIRVTAA